MTAGAYVDRQSLGSCTLSERNAMLCETCGQLIEEASTPCPRCLSPTIEMTSPPQPAPQIPGYFIRETLGRGGMGVVYLAEDLTLERRVALKVLSERLAADDSARLRFLREARIMATIEHPHVVRIYEFGENNGVAFISMEYIEGETLAERVFRLGRLSPEEALAVLRQVTEALEAAWEKQVVHRDIKPHNILIDRKNRVCVSDFGLARPLNACEAQDLTDPGSAAMMGTPGYMSPEQVRGQSLDFRSDIYSLGIVLYEMLSGKQPFIGKTAIEIMSHHIHSPLPGLSDINPGINDLLQSMTHKNPKDRPDSYPELLSNIHFLKQRSFSSYSKSSGDTFAWIIAAVVILAGIALGLFYLPQKAVQSMVVPPPQYQQVTFSGMGSGGELSPDGTMLAYSSEKKVWIQNLKGGEPRSIFQGESLKDIRWSPDGSYISFYNGDRTDNRRQLIVIPRNGGPVRKLLGAAGHSWSPDGSEIAFIWTGRNLIFVINLTSGQLRKILLPGNFNFIWQVEWCAANNHLLYAISTENTKAVQIWTIHADGKNPQLITEAEGIVNARWSPDGKAVYWTQTQDELTANMMKILISPVTERPVGSPKMLLAGVNFFEFSLSQRNLLTYSKIIASNNLWLGNLQHQQKSDVYGLRQLTKQTSLIPEGKISPDGKRIAFIFSRSAKADIHVVSTDGGAPNQITFLDGVCDTLDWSPDGKQIVFVLSKSGSRSLWIVNSDGTGLRQIKNTRMGTLSGNRSLSWGPGNKILYPAARGNQNFQMLDLNTLKDNSLVKDDSVGWIFQPSFSPDGKQVAVFWNRSPMRGMWLITLNPYSEQPLLNGSAENLRWSSDGKSIFTTSFSKVDVHTGKQEQLAPLKNNAYSDLDFQLMDCTGDGRTLLLNQEKQQSDVWLVRNFDPESSTASK